MKPLFDITNQSKMSKELTIEERHELCRLRALQRHVDHLISVGETAMVVYRNPDVKEMQLMQLGHDMYVGAKLKEAYQIVDVEVPPLKQ